jgi:hypothetical protein
MTGCKRTYALQGHADRGLMLWRHRRDRTHTTTASSTADPQPLTIGEFYDADPRRRGPDRSFGRGWNTDLTPNVGYNAYWIPATGELFVMRAPNPGLIGSPGGPRFDHVLPIREEDLTVDVLAVLSETELEDALAGWREMVTQPNSLDWLWERVKHAAP